jgi:hypothetical protein
MKQAQSTTLRPHYVGPSCEAMARVLSWACMPVRPPLGRIHIGDCACSWLRHMELEVTLGCHCRPGVLHRFDSRTTATTSSVVTCSTNYTCTRIHGDEDRGDYFDTPNRGCSRATKFEAGGMTLVLQHATTVWGRRGHGGFDAGHKSGGAGASMSMTVAEVPHCAGVCSSISRRTCTTCLTGSSARSISATPRDSSSSTRCTHPIR